MLIASARPDLFAAIAPVSGGAPMKGDALNSLLEKLKALPVMIVHGARDGLLRRSFARDGFRRGKGRTQSDSP